MIRLLSVREDTTHSELVLVCQDHCNWCPTGFSNVVQINLGSPDYHKPLFCNVGVEATSSMIVALLDSDRVLPQGWFSKASSLASPTRAITTTNLIRCRKPYNDDDINVWNIETDPDPKCTINTLMRKNGFSGNTVLFRSSYLATGGMDESFTGYGFADNDMVENCKHHGIEFLFLDDPEIHLHHEKYIVIGDESQSQCEFRVRSLFNGLRFCQKWKRQPNQTMLNLLKLVNMENKNSPLLAEINHLASLFKTF